jgi:hypothetical protein
MLPDGGQSGSSEEEEERFSLIDYYFPFLSLPLSISKVYMTSLSHKPQNFVKSISDFVQF